MTPTFYAILINVACSIGAILVIFPLAVYLLRDWTTRRDRLFTYFDRASLGLYYTQFYPSLKLNEDCEKYFRGQFHRLYGRRYYVLPFVLLALVTIAAAWSLSRTLQVWEKVGSANYALPPIAAAALLGAFAWVVTDQLGRFRRRDFTVTDTYNAVFRILIALPFGFAFAKIAADSAGVVVAFLLGAFPTKALFTIARRIGAQKLGIGDSQESSGNLELERLQSIGKSNAERYQDIGITTIAELAWSDPVEITIRTNFDFNYVIDCMSQALLWLYFEDKAKQLYVYSLRGAQEACALAGCQAAGVDQTPDAAKVIAQIAKAMQIDEDSLSATLTQVANDPYTQFILKVWH